MATKQIAVEAVLANLNTFLGGVKRINDAVASIGQQVKVSKGHIEMFGASFNQAAQRWQEMGKGKHFVSSAEVAQRLTTALQGVSEGAIQSVSAVRQMSTAFEEATAAATGTDKELKKKPGDMQDVVGSSFNLEGALNVARLGFQGLGIAANAVGRIFGGIKGVITGVVDAFRRFFSSIGGGFVKVFQIAAGYAFGRMLTWLGQQIGNVGREAVAAAAQFQLLEIRFRTVAARDISREFGTSISDAFEAASLRAQQLLEWTRQLAITTPFKAKDVARSLALANAYGLQAEEAQVLTAATLDFAAAMGLGEDHIYRIIYNFGQMQQQGKLTGREFRDLAISFVPVHDVIAEMADEAGIAAEEMEKMALEGGVPVEAFFRKFVNMVNRDFKGAANAMASTLAGVYDNIKDTFELLIGVDFLGPLAELIAPALNTVLDAMKGFREGAMIMGGVLKLSFFNVAQAITRELLPAIGNLLGAFGFVNTGARGVAKSMAMVAFGIRDAILSISKGINTIAEWVREHLGGLQDNGHTYGYNLVMNFAKGMAAAIKFIVQVIATIARIIVTAFKANSPPKIAPQIDKYGAEMMKAWAQGAADESDDIAERIIDRDAFQKALKERVDTRGSNPLVEVVRDFAAEARLAVQPLLDRFGSDIMAGIMGGFSSRSFNLFKDIAGMSESFTRSLEGLSMDEVGIVPTILGTREAIANTVDAVRKGFTSVGDAVSKITKAMGQAPRGFADYIEGVLKLERAEANLADAQKLGQSVLESNEQILSRMTGSVGDAGRAYVTALNNMTAASRESEIADKALADITDFYSEKLKALKRSLEEVTDAYDEKLELEEIDKALATNLLTARERERLEMRRRAIMIEQEIRATEEARDAEVGAAEKRVDAAKEAEDAASKELERRKTLLTELAEQQVAAAEEQVEAAKALIEVQIEQNELIREQMNLLEQLANKAKGAGGGGIDPEDMGIGDLSDLIGDLETFEIPNVDEIVSQIMQDARVSFGSWKEDMKKAIAEAFGEDSWEDLVKRFNDELVVPITEAVESVRRVYEQELKPLWSGLNERLSPAFERLGRALGRLATANTELMDSVGLKGGVGNLRSFVYAITLLAAEWVATNLDRVAQGLELIATVLEKIKLIGPMNIFELLTGGPEDQIRTGVKDAATGEVGEGIGTWIGDFFERMFGDDTNLENLGKDTVLSIKKGMDSGFDEATSDYGGESGKPTMLINTIAGVFVNPTSIEKLANAAYTLFGGAGTGMQTKGEEINGSDGTIQQFLNNTLAGFVLRHIDFNTGGFNLFDNVKTGFQTVVDIITGESGPPKTMIGKVLQMFVDNNEDMLRKSFTMWDKIRIALDTVVPLILGENGLLVTMIQNIVDKITNAYGSIKTAARTALSGLVDGASEKVDAFIDWLERRIGDIKRLLGQLGALEIPSPFGGSGSGGGSGGAGDLGGVGEDLASSMIKGYEDAARIASPSKVWDRLGKYTMDGFINGINSRMGELKAQMKETMRVADAVRNNRVQAPQRYNNINNSRNVTIQVDANYANTQSPVDIYYDISAALASSNL